LKFCQQVPAKPLSNSLGYHVLKGVYVMYYLLKGTLPSANFTIRLNCPRRYAANPAY